MRGGREWSVDRHGAVYEYQSLLLSLFSLPIIITTTGNFKGASTPPTVVLYLCRGPTRSGFVYPIAFHHPATFTVCSSVTQQQSCCTSSRFWRWWALPTLCQTPQPTVRRLLQHMAPLRPLRRNHQLRQARSQSAARLRHRNTPQPLPEASQLRPALLLAPLTAMAGTAATQPTRTLQARPAS